MFVFRNKNLLNNSKEPDCRRSKISNTGDQNLVGSVFDVREVLIIVGSLITDQHCPKKESLYDMVTNLLPQILFDAFNLAILIDFYLHTTQTMFKIDHSLRICDLLKSR